MGLHLCVWARPGPLKWAIGLLWLLFLPNAAYLITDVGHITYQWSHLASPSDRAPLLLQYLIFETFGAVTFAASIAPFDRLARSVLKTRGVLYAMLFNVLIGFGVVLGRYEHINSWVALARPLVVLRSAAHIFVSVNLLELVLLFGLVCSGVYFVFRGVMIRD